MKILITGSSGYLGRNTVMRALKRGHAVRGFDIKASGITHHAYRETVADITDPDAMAKAARGTDAVFHLAAALAQFERDERRMHRVNVGGTANVLSAAAKLKVRKVVFISSVEVYGVKIPVPCPEDAPIAPVCQYGRDKAAAEMLCREYLERGLDVTVFRPPTINGPGQNEPFLVEQMEAITRGKPTILPGGGKTRLQMVYVGDVAQAMFLALSRASSRGQFLNLGSDDVPSLKELALALYSHAGTRPKFISVPAAVARAAVRTLSFFGVSPLEPQHLEIALRDYVFDNSRAKELLKWKPSKNDIESAIEAYDWHIKGGDR